MMEQPRDLSVTSERRRHRARPPGPETVRLSAAAVPTRDLELSTGAEQTRRGADATGISHSAPVASQGHMSLRRRESTGERPTAAAVSACVPEPVGSFMLNDTSSVRPSGEILRQKYEEKKNQTKETQLSKKYHIMLLHFQEPSGWYPALPRLTLWTDSSSD
ncbi:hypothetical protein F2P81_004068 [Scophthalmus maximus]|uniref:Uncharacterized protein n=1 Tax=Scophthalmus maximus TaxID=52904 RepID=A0A6A4TIN3_SCOMX|nr:hypothetical protein F2P81_004068 [Scophthalmus maximus]